MKTLRFLSFFCLIILFSFSSCSEEEDEQEDLRPQCEISNTGTLSFINNSSYTISLQLNGLTPNGFGYITPGQTVSTIITAGIMHTFSGQPVGSSSGSWGGQVSVGTCLEQTVTLTN